MKYSVSLSVAVDSDHTYTRRLSDTDGINVILPANSNASDENTESGKYIFFMPATHRQETSSIICFQFLEHVICNLVPDSVVGLPPFHGGLPSLPSNPGTGGNPVLVPNGTCSILVPQCVGAGSSNVYQP